MTVTGVVKDPQALTMSVTAEYDAPVERVWQLWADPRLLERWWGPPEYPATVVEHDLAPGGRVSYFMTGPEGERFPGWWRVIEVEPPTLLHVEDGFSDDAGEPDESMPTTTMRVRLERVGDLTRMTIESTFPSAAAMAQLVEMGMEEGICAALGQADALLAGSGADVTG